jgi:IMP cyclohydrolase
MLYNEGITYSEPYFQYNGVRVVEPSSFGPTANITDFKILQVIILYPESIDSTLVFIGADKVIIGSGQEQVTESTAIMSFDTYNSGYIAFSVNEEEAYAIASAETIIVEDNSAGTVDVTIIPTA